MAKETLYRLTGKASYGVVVQGKTVTFHKGTDVPLSTAEKAAIGKEDMAFFTEVKDEAPAAGEPKLKDMTKDQLLTFAEEKEIVVDPDLTKDKILAAIEEALKEKAAKA